MSIYLLFSLCLSLLHNLPDLGTVIQPEQLSPQTASSQSPSLQYPLQVTTPGTYTLWLRGLASDAQADSLYAHLAGQTIGRGSGGGAI